MDDRTLAAAARREVPELAALFPFESKYVDLQGHACHYVDEGRGEPVVAVHGNPTWSFAFRHIIRGLADRYRMIALDHIGCGLSAKPSDAEYPYDLARRVADFGRFVDQLGLDRISLIVHDWGGVIALSWAVQHVSRVRSIVVLNSAAFLPPATKRIPLVLHMMRSPFPGEYLVRRANLFLWGALRTNVAGRLSHAEFRSYSFPYRTFSDRRALYRFVEDIPVNAQHRSYALLQRTDQALHTLQRVPMLFCWGMRDYVFDGKVLDEWVARMPGAAVQRYPKAHHFVFEDAHGPLEDRIRAFFADVHGPVT